jgi:hypothetical protein
VGIPAIIVGLYALRDIRQSMGERTGSGFAIAGIVLGILVCLFSLVVVGAFFLLFIWAEAS